MEMLEEGACIIPRNLPNSREQETQLPDLPMTYPIEAEIPNGKRRLDGESEVDGEGDGEGEGGGLRKTNKMLEIEGKLPRAELERLSLVQPVVSYTGYPPLSSDGAHKKCQIVPIGHDMTLNCLIRCSRADYGSIASLNKGFRSLIKSGQIYKLRRQHDKLEHWVYFSCSLLEWVAFDPVNKHWTQLPRMNANEIFMCSDKESMAVGTDLLVLGKDLMSHVIYRYSVITNSWSSGMSMHAPRCLFGSASYGDIAIFAGGCNSQGKILSTVELYDAEERTWVTLPDMIKPRKMCSGIFMDGKFYVIGGTGSGKSPNLTCGEEFDLNTCTWREIPHMSPVTPATASENGIPPPIGAPPLVAVVKNQLYAADYDKMDLKKYNKETGLWVTIGKLPERVGSMNGWGIAFRACGDRLIVIGGPRVHGEGFVEINSWIPSEGPPRWELLATKQSGSFVYNCAVMSC